MKLLYILRHGKSSPAPAGKDDHDRALDDSGRAEAEALGRHFAERGWQPARALVSPARRTRETTSCFNKGLAGGGANEVAAVFEPALCPGPADRILDELAVVEDGLPSVLIVAHNPGLQDLAVFLSGRQHGALRARLVRDFPPAALAVFELAIDHWRNAAPGNARLAEVVFPQDLG